MIQLLYLILEGPWGLISQSNLSVVIVSLMFIPSHGPTTLTHRLVVLESSLYRNCIIRQPSFISSNVSEISSRSASFFVSTLGTVVSAMNLLI